MMVWVASGGEALPLFHRDTVGRDTLTMFATSAPLSPPRCSRSSKIRATALSITTGTPTCCIYVSQGVLNDTELYLPIAPCIRNPRDHCGPALHGPNPALPRIQLPSMPYNLST